MDMLFDKNAQLVYTVLISGELIPPMLADFSILLKFHVK